jgi:hypothetical protein
MRPAVPRSEHVPGPQDGGAEPGRREERLGLGARLPVRAQERRRVRDADVDEMRDAGGGRRRDRGLRRREVDRSEGEGCGTPTSCRKVSDGATRGAKVSASSALPSIAPAPGGRREAEPGRTRARTACPRSTRSGRTARPT